MASTVDKIKENLLDGSLKEEMTQQIVLEYLLEIAHLANGTMPYFTRHFMLTISLDMTEFALEQHRGTRERVKSQISDVAWDQVRAANEPVEPDGESFGITSLPGSRTQGSPCVLCNDEIKVSESLISYMGRQYHVNCFRCCGCDHPVEDALFLTRQSKPICRSCSPQCQTCQLPITSDCFMALDSFFHLTCFRCVECSKLIDIEDQFYRRSSGPCCSSCVSDKRQSVFGQRWDPDMNTRFSNYLSELSPMGMSFDDEPVISRSQSLEELNISDSPSDNLKPRAKQQTLIGSTASPSVMKRTVSESVLGTRQERNTPPLHILANEEPDLDELEKVHSHDPKFTPLSVKSLEGVLSSRFGIDCLVNYCIEEYCVEKLFFWMDVEQFRLLAEQNTPDALRYAKTMYMKYIEIGSEMEIFLDKRMCNQIGQQIRDDRAPSDIFDAAQKDTFSFLQNAVMPKFLASEQGRRYLKTMVRKHAEKVMSSPASSLPKIFSPDVICKYPDFMVSMEVVGAEVYSREMFYEVEIRRVRDLFPTDKADIRFQQNKFRPKIYRPYKEFLDLHVALCRYFPELRQKIPRLPQKPTSLLSLAKPKNLSADINKYLTRLFEMPQNVVQSVIMREFIKPNKMDMENFDFEKRLPKQ